MDNEQQSNANQDNQSGEKKTWTSGENQFSNMSDEEKKRHLGWNPGSGELEQREKDSANKAQDEQSGDQNA